MVPDGGGEAGLGEPGATSGRGSERRDLPVPTCSVPGIGEGDGGGGGGLVLDGGGGGRLPDCSRSGLGAPGTDGGGVSARRALPVSSPSGLVLGGTCEGLAPDGGGGGGLLPSGG